MSLSCAAPVAVLIALGGATQAAPSYRCPMHPEVMSPSPGVCSRCQMVLQPSPTDVRPLSLRIEPRPASIEAGRPVVLTIEIQEAATGTRVADWVAVHERLLHLFVVSEELDHFQHLHPVQGEPGRFTVQLTLPHPGRYQLIAELHSRAHGPQQLQRALLTHGYRGDLRAAQLRPDATRSRSSGGLSARLSDERLTAGRPTLVTVHLQREGAPVTDLEPYLGAWAHALLVSDDLLDVLHIHPEPATKPGGPDLLLELRPPRARTYRLWLQVLRNGSVTTFPFTFSAVAPGALPQRDR